MFISFPVAIRPCQQQEIEIAGDTGLDNVFRGPTVGPNRFHKCGRDLKDGQRAPRLFYDRFRVIAVAQRQHAQCHAPPLGQIGGDEDRLVRMPASVMDDQHPLRKRFGHRGAEQQNGPIYLFNERARCGRERRIACGPLGKRSINNNQIVQKTHFFYPVNGVAGLDEQFAVNGRGVECGPEGADGGRFGGRRVVGGDAEDAQGRFLFRA